MGRPLNKRFFAGGTGTTVGCTVRIGGTNFESAIISQKSSSRFRVAGAGGTPLTFSSLAFAEANPDTITRTGGADLTVTFSVGDSVRVASSENTGENDGVYEIATVTSTVITITLDGDFVANSDDTAATLALVASNGVLATLVQDTPVADNTMQVTVTPELLAASAEAQVDFGTSDLALLTQAQDETAYDGAGNNGTFVAGSGYAAPEILTMSDGTTITVDVDSTGAVTDFTVTTASSTPLASGTTRTQTSTNKSGTGFTLTPNALPASNNEIPRGVVTSVTLVDGGSGYFANGSFNITVASDAEFVAGTEALISFTVLNQAINSVGITTPGVGYQSLGATTDINTADIPDAGSTAPVESAQTINARQVKTFEGNTFVWPATGGGGSGGRGSFVEADLQSTDL